jgi:hypothetical protein
MITLCVGAAPPTSAEEPDLSMTADVANDVDLITSKLFDFHGAALSAGLPIDDDEYEQIISTCDGNSVTPVSAFNSSI